MGLRTRIKENKLNTKSFQMKRVTSSFLKTSIYLISKQKDLEKEINLKDQRNIKYIMNKNGLNKTFSIIKR